MIDTATKRGRLVSGAVPRRSPLLFGLFRRYATGYVARHFHAVRLSKGGFIPSLTTPGPIVVVLNHASWWDPMVGLPLSELFGDRAHFAPIDSVGLAKYPFLERLGFFGIEPDSPRGGLTFLRRSLAVLGRCDREFPVFCPLPPGEGGRRPGEGLAKALETLTPTLSHGERESNQAPLPRGEGGRRPGEGLVAEALEALTPTLSQGERETKTPRESADIASPGRPDAILWVTAQGRFADPRERPTRLKEGVGRLARRMETGYVLPMALEYPFWEERTPEALARFGPPIAVGTGDTAAGWTARIEDALEAVQDALAADAMSRDPSRFHLVLSGRSGVGGVYDGWRRLKAAARGERFVATHGEG